MMHGTYCKRAPPLLILLTRQARWLGGRLQRWREAGEKRDGEPEGGGAGGGLGGVIVNEKSAATISKQLSERGQYSHTPYGQKHMDTPAY